MKLKKLISVFLAAALFCTTFLVVNAAIGEESYDLSQIRPVSIDGPVTVNIAIKDEGDSASYDTITAYVNGAAVASASGVRSGDSAVKITFPADTFLPGANKVEYKATLNGELYKTVTKTIYGLKEVDGAETILAANYDNLSSITVSGWENKDTSWGTDVFQIVGDNDATTALTLEQDGTNKYLKYAPDGSGSTFIRMRWTKSDTYTDGIIKLSTDVYVPDTDTINKTNIYCYSGSHQYDISEYLKAGQWNKIHWLFNIDKKSYNMYVEGVGSMLGEWSVNVPDEISLTAIDSKELRSEFYVNSGKYIYIDNVKVEHLSADYDLFSISAPAEAINTAALSIRPYMAGEAKTYVDGVLLSTDTLTAGEEIVKNIDAATFGAGIKDIRVVGTLENGETYIKYARVNLSSRVESGIGTATGTVIDFNDLNTDCTNQVSALFTTNVASVTRIAGKSGADGDYAALFDFGTVTTQDYDGGLVELTGTGGQRATLLENGGKFAIEFDLMFYEGSPNMYLRLPFCLWGTSTSEYLMNGGSNKLRDTESAITSSQWNSLKFIYDIDNNQWSAWLNNTQQTLSVASEPEGFSSDRSIQFRFGRRPNNYKNQFALDNVRAYHIEEGVNVSSITVDGTEVEDYAISAGTKTVNVALSGEYAAEGKVYRDGALDEGFTVATTDNKNYAVTGTFEANHQYKIEIGNVTTSLYVTDANGIYLKIFDGNIADGIFNADIECYMAEETEDEIKVVTAAYNGNRLISVNIEDLGANSGLTSVRKQLSYEGAITMAKVMIWNDMVPYAESPEYVPAQ